MGKLFGKSLTILSHVSEVETHLDAQFDSKLQSVLIDSGRCLSIFAQSTNNHSIWLNPVRLQKGLINSNCYNTNCSPFVSAKCFSIMLLILIKFNLILFI